MTRDYQNIIAGGLLTVIGLLAAGVAGFTYPIGTFNHMEAGMFPLLVGILLAGIGLLVLMPAVFTVGHPIPKPDYRSVFFVLLALLVFAISIDWFGLIPAVILLTITSVLADNKLGLIGTVILAIGLSLIAWLIFSVALEIPLQLFKWPFA
jgi:putative tricarboxylic transport membrane protein